MDEDKTLDLESAETQPESSTEETPEDLETTPDSSEEEVAWSKLHGKAQERFRQVIRERNELAQKLEQAKERVETSTVPSQEPGKSSYSDEEVQLAVRKLKEAGLAGKEELESKIEGIINRLETNRTHDSLERKYSGENGWPKYDREEVEDYARRKNIWNLEAAYRDMYFDEITDAAKLSKKKRVYTEKPGAPSDNREEPVTLESVRKQLSGPKGMEYYDKLARDPAKLDALLKQLSS